MKKWKNALNKILVKTEDYNFVLDYICENNRKSLIILCTAFCTIFAVLSTLGILNIGISKKDVSMFLLTFICIFGVLLFILKTPKHNRRLIMSATYLLIGVTMVYGLVASYRSPEQYTASFIALMSIIFMTFVDKPGRLALTNIFGAILCIIMICVHKADFVRTADLVNVISYSVLSLISGFFTVNMKIHGYVMDKLHEQDLEKGRQQLNAKEMEASYLLTAIEASYDMVVFVNLTQNTYKLIGEESFVTRGDISTGNFDDVINIHAGKVVEEQRQCYYDTFSREGLLKACAEGKKEVYLEYQQYDENGVPHWLGTHTMFITDPDSTDITEITISQNIDERVQKEAESRAILQRERDKAEQARKAKTDFLFQMSHDIRTPMNAILGFTKFIKFSDELDKIHKEYVPKLETAGGQLLMLINDALEMSRIESGKLVFCRTIQDIRSIITNVITVMQIQADEKGVELISDFSVSHPIVNCDNNHINRVVMNLLSNAVKFTPAGGRVTVSLREQPDAPEGYTLFELKIADTGVGMSPEFLKKAFEPFEREQTSTVSGMQGTGLGLPIVKKIVDTAGDRISVESKQGEGTVFTLNLKLQRREETELSSTRQEEEGNLPMEQMAEYFKGKRILLVEDNEFNLAIAQTLLENAGFSVEMATDGRMAVNKVTGAPTPTYYDAILMDVQMPVMNGYEATREIRALKDKRAQTRIIAVTANAFDTDKQDAIEAGMNGHIAKPIDVTALYRTLWNIL